MSIYTIYKKLTKQKAKKKKIFTVGISQYSITVCLVLRLFLKLSLNYISTFIQDDSNKRLF